MALDLTPYRNDSVLRGNLRNDDVEMSDRFPEQSTYDDMEMTDWIPCCGVAHRSTGKSSYFPSVADLLASVSLLAM